MKEIWRKVKEHPSYEVSTMGQVRKYLKQSPDSEGYARVSVDGHHMRVHQLVMEAFGYKKSPRHIVDHKDGNKSRSILANLQYVTPSENSKNASKNGQLRSGLRRVREIIGKNEETGEEIWFPSICQAAREIGCDNSEIVKCLSKKRKTAHGFKFWYVEDYLKETDSDWVKNQVNRQLSMFE